MPSPRRRFELGEYEAVDVPMSAETARDLLRVSQARLSVTPAPVPASFRVQAQQYVGTVVLDDFDVLIRPKVPMENLLYLLGVGIPATSWLPEQFRYAVTRDLLAAFAEYYVRATEAAIMKGLLRSYREHRERVPALRGRLDFPIAVRQPGLAFPLACVFDDYTADILENRVLKAASRRLLQLIGIESNVRSRLLRLFGRFEDVLEDLPNLELVDRIVFTRLNRHYEASLKLATLILRETTISDRAGRVAASAFLLDMNDVFQNFLTAKLRELLRHRLTVDSEPGHSLGTRREAMMYPDLLFLKRGLPVYVGDAKYKLTSTGRAINDDYYQLLAYTTALDLDEGVLVYCQADGPTPPRNITVRNAGKRLWTWAVNLSGSRQEIEASLSALGEWIIERSSGSRHQAVA